MYRLISVVVAANDQIVMVLTGDGSRTTRPFTVTDGWEVRWKATNELSFFLLDALGHSIGNAGGASYHAKGGTYLLRISSNAHWTVTVVQLP